MAQITVSRQHPLDSIHHKCLDRMLSDNASREILDIRHFLCLLYHASSMPAMSLKDVDGASTGPGMPPASQGGNAFGRPCTLSTAFSIAPTIYSAPDAVHEDSHIEHRHNGIIETGASPDISKRRHDSGYGELSHQDTTVSSPPSRPTSMDTNPLHARTKSGSPRRAHTTPRYSHISASSSPASRTPQSRTTSRTTTQSAIPTSSPRTRSRHSSTTHAPRSSPSSSRRSSKTLTQIAASTKTPRPLLPTRSSSTAYALPRPEDPFSIHHRSCNLFHSLSANPSPHSPSTSASQTTASRPSRSTPTPASTSTSPTENPTSTYLPATTIDWTHPSTRQSEYEKIDRSCRGLRGVWRKIAPRWCRGSSHLGFSQVGGGEEGGSDAGSVRRYRVEVAGEKGEGGEKGRRRGWGVFCGRGM